MFRSTSLKNSKLWRERRIVGSFLLFCVIYFGISTVIFWICGLGPLYRVMRSRSWGTCPAVVTKSYRKMAYRGIKVYMRYEYLWQNQNLESNQYDFFLSYHSYGDLGYRLVGKIVDSFPPGKRIECLVNPKNPSEAVVTREIPWMAWFGILPPFILILGGIYCVQSAVRGFFKKKQPPTKEIQETKEQS